MTTGWTELFEAWHEAVLGFDETPPATLFRPPADARMIDDLEARLGTRLPPSYRAFLEHTNGAPAMPGWGIVRTGLEQELAEGLLSVESVAWLRDYDPAMATWLEAPESDDAEAAWHHPAFDPRETERDYLYPEGGGDLVAVKSGHLLYSLAITAIVDGYHTVLNPLVVDADGEWEAWDDGTKLPGALRYASFADLLEADIAQRRRYKEQADEAKAGAAVLVGRVQDPAAALDDRLAAAWQAFGAGARAELEPGLAAIALDAGMELASRQAALRLLGYIGGRDALDVLVRVSTDREPRLRALTVPPLAASREPSDREVAIAILADPETPDFVVRSTYRPAGDAVWEAYRRSANPALLPQLAYLGEMRAADDIVAALRDTGRTSDEVRDLLTYAHYLADPRIAVVLAGLARRQPARRSNIAASLVSAGALNEAIPLLIEALAEGGEGYGQPEQALAHIRDPRAAAALLTALRLRPSESIARAIGWHPSPEAVAALEAVLDQPAIHLAGIDALELMAIPEAMDALARRSAAGDGYATRALARRRDPRAREPLLAWLADADPHLARLGADGLRDLRDPHTSKALLAAASHDDPDVAVCAVHALVGMSSPEASGGLAALGRHPDERARALAAHWKERRAAGPHDSPASPAESSR
jgi:hypothetical protein